jgi:hypothetical protein
MLLKEGAIAVLQKKIRQRTGDWFETSEVMMLN